MFLASTLSENVKIMDAAVIAVLGYAVVFFGLILLMIVVIALGKTFVTRKENAEPKSANPTATPVPPAASAEAAASGSAGKLKLHDVDPKTAAMLMAIVAHKMGKPLNELRFISIREVK